MKLFKEFLIRKRFNENCVFIGVIGVSFRRFFKIIVDFIELVNL